MYLPTWKRLYIQGFPPKIDENTRRFDILGPDPSAVYAAHALETEDDLGLNEEKKIIYITRAFWVDRVKTVQPLRYLAKSHHSTPSIKTSPLLAATSNLLQALHV